MTVDSGADEMLADVAVASDGAIVIAGRTTAGGRATIYRLTPRVTVMPASAKRAR